MPRLSVVLSDQADGHPFKETHIATTCQSCERAQGLDDAIFDCTKPSESKYLCAGCLEPVLILSESESGSWKDRGYELGDWVLRNPRDVVVDETHTGRPLRFVGVAGALDA